jgi:hypothetical protein
MEIQSSVPSPTETIRDLGSRLPTIVAALRFGARKTKEFFDREHKNRPVDRYLAPNLLRFFAKKFLLAVGQLVVDEEDEDQALDFQHVANNGLFLRCGRYLIRIRKSDDGDVPGPGNSESRQHYYQQIIPEAFAAGDDPAEVNLLIAWDTIAPFTIYEVILACPRHAKASKSSVMLHWRHVIPLLAAIEGDSGIDGADDDDLDLRLNSETAVSEEDE